MPGGWEWIIILLVALLLFGGSRLAGVGKGMGRSIREFKEEVRSVDEGKERPEVVDAEIVNPMNPNSAATPTAAGAYNDARRSDAGVDSRQMELDARERELNAREEELRRQREAGL